MLPHCTLLHGVHWIEPVRSERNATVDDDEQPPANASAIAAHNTRSTRPGIGQI
jgi:hypothetical protein